VCFKDSENPPLSYTVFQNEKGQRQRIHKTEEAERDDHDVNEGPPSDEMTSSDSSGP